jgi:hypothetical protein
MIKYLEITPRGNNNLFSNKVHVCNNLCYTLDSLSPYTYCVFLRCVLMFVHVWCDVHLHFPNVLNACSLYLDNGQSEVPECVVGDPLHQNHTLPTVF